MQPLLKSFQMDTDFFLQQMIQSSEAPLQKRIKLPAFEDWISNIDCVHRSSLLTPSAFKRIIPFCNFQLGTQVPA